MRPEIVVIIAVLLMSFAAAWFLCVLEDRTEKNGKEYADRGREK